MKILSLKIANFRDLTFSHDFTDTRFVVLTGINGSGKSTILEAIDLLLTRQASQIQQQYAAQVTADKAVFEIETYLEDQEIEYLANRLKNATNNPVEISEIVKALRSKLFTNNKLTRKIEITKKTLGWDVHKDVAEYINGQLVNPGGSSGINNSEFQTLARELVLKFENLENINLQFTNPVNQAYSIQDIFQQSNVNEQTRLTGRTNVSASPFLNSLLKIETPDQSEILRLLDQFNQILDPISLELGTTQNGFTPIHMRRKGQKHSYALDSASSGQKKAIVLATLKAIWDKSVFKPIVLLDEPENSMHPGMVSKLFKYLGNFPEGMSNSAFIIATHSPDVVSNTPENTYRIINDGNISSLYKISGLEARAKVLAELGVNFHLDYVAQKIVFVESDRDKSSGLNDESAYQQLIDPDKERVLFISTGSKKSAKAKYQFQQELFAKLKSSNPELIEVLTDRDADNYDETTNTPFKHIEYIYLSNPEVIARCLTSLLTKKVAVEDVNSLLSQSDTTQRLADEKYKDVWDGLTSHFKIKKKLKELLEKKIVQSLHEDPSLQDQLVSKIVSRFA